MKLIQTCIVVLSIAVTAIVIGRMMSVSFLEMDWKSSWKCFEYWINRYQTFLGVLVAIAVAYLTVGAMTKQNNISERQFLSGQVQTLLSDRATLQFVIAQLKEAKSQKQIFGNNIAFLDTEGDKSVGWQNGPNLIRTAFVNVEGFRNLVSANTAKFMEPTGSRAKMVAKLDEIVGSQDALKDSFYRWALLNRNSNADPSIPPSSEKKAFLLERDAVLKLFDDLLILANKAAAELESKVVQVERDISDLQKLIASKANN